MPKALRSYLPILPNSRYLSMNYLTFFPLFILVCYIKHYIPPILVVQDNLWGEGGHEDGIR